uniref:NR LBD domain-containing protein n=1 Tax=Acrobeloides nanus TaxID=290746 RepID=A0A914CW12_9BILA
MIKLLYKPMIELKLTQFELVYLLAQILWSTQEIKDLESSTHDIANNMTDRIATELHNYYVNEEQLENYSPRLIKMLKLIDGSKSLLNHDGQLCRTSLLAVYHYIYWTLHPPETLHPPRAVHPLRTLYPLDTFIH